MSCGSRTYTCKRTDTTTVIGAFRELYARAKKISETYDYVKEVILEKNKHELQQNTEPRIIQIDYVKSLLYFVLNP
jgi:hypothetical protein